MKQSSRQSKTVKFSKAPEKDGKYTIYRGLENSLSNSKQFTVYNGTISEPISSTGTYVGKTCEILPHLLTPVRYTNYTRQNFIKLDYFPVVTNLTWQDIPDDYLKVLSHAHASRFGVPKTIKLKTTFLPASSCQINVAGVNLSLSTVTNAIISHDKDWSNAVLKMMSISSILWLSITALFR